MMKYVCYLPAVEGTRVIVREADRTYGTEAVYQFGGHSTGLFRLDWMPLDVNGWAIKNVLRILEPGEDEEEHIANLIDRDCNWP